MIEFVVREGPMFEAMIMNRELNNPMFRFLFDNQSPAHVYYRWKLFSILQGDSPYQYKTDEFRIFKGGSIWKPPPLNPYTSGMPEELVDRDDDQKKGRLSDSQRDRLEDMLRDLLPEKQKVGDSMVWCLEHAESAEEIVECIAESLSILQTPLPKKIARLFLVSDILYNSSAKVPNASFFRKYFEAKLPEIFRDIHETYEKIDARLKAEQFKHKVMNCFRAWEDWAVYPNDLLIRMQNIFLGLVPVEKSSDNDRIKDKSPEDYDGTPLGRDLDYDGKPMDSDLDGAPMEEDYDGEPMFKEDLDGRPMKHKKSDAKLKFKPSKWETVDEDTLKEQAVSTSKWDFLDQDEDHDGEPMDEDLDGQPLEDDDTISHSRGDEDEDSRSRISQEEYGPVYDPRDNIRDMVKREEMTSERRAKLREVEVKVMKYQDEIEGGKRNRKGGLTISEQVEKYRQKLLQKVSSSLKTVSKKEEEKYRRRDSKRNRDTDRGRGRDNSASSDESDNVPSSYRSGRGPPGRRMSNSPSPVPVRRRPRSRSLSPLYSDNYSARKRAMNRSRSRSPRRMSPSPSPHNYLRVGSHSSTPPYRRRSSSRSPSRHKHKRKKTKH